MKVEDCIKNGLIKKDGNAKGRVDKSIEIAQRFLESAKRNFEIEDYVMSSIAAYNSAFHSARALLFSKGYVERSHTCLIVALKEMFKKEILLVDFLNTLDRLRMTRHKVQYGGYLITKEEAEFLVDFAEEFLNHAREILKSVSEQQDR